LALDSWETELSEDELDELSEEDYFSSAITDSSGTSSFFSMP
jgi:hypothetical protein